MAGNYVSALANLLMAPKAPSLEDALAAAGFTGKLRRVGDPMLATQPMKERAMSLEARLAARRRSIEVPELAWTMREISDAILGPGEEFAAGTVFYKVLTATGGTILAGKQWDDDANARHWQGEGVLDYPLPAEDGTPGPWMPRLEVRKDRPILRVADPEINESGYFVTPNPMLWPYPGMRVFEIEAPELWTRDIDLGTEAIAPTIRLVRERPDLVPDWWHEIERFLAESERLPLFTPTARPDPRWRMVQTRDQVRLRGASSGRRLLSALELAQERRGVGPRLWLGIKGTVQKVMAASLELRGLDPDFDRPEQQWAGDFVRHIVLKVALIVAGDEAPEWAAAEVNRRWEVWQKGYGLRDVMKTPSSETWVVYRRPTAEWSAWSQKAA